MDLNLLAPGLTLLTVLGKMLRLVEDDADFSRFWMFSELPNYISDILAKNEQLSSFHFRFDELFTQVLKILPSQVDNVQEMFEELSAMDQTRKKTVIFNPSQRHQEL